VKETTSQKGNPTNETIISRDPFDRNPVTVEFRDYSKTFKVKDLMANTAQDATRNRPGTRSPLCNTKNTK
jgi:hypothetical protein